MESIHTKEMRNVPFAMSQNCASTPLISPSFLLLLTLTSLSHPTARLYYTRLCSAPLACLYSQLAMTLAFGLRVCGFEFWMPRISLAHQSWCIPCRTNRRTCTGSKEKTRTKSVLTVFCLLCMVSLNSFTVKRLVAPKYEPKFGTPHGDRQGLPRL